MATRRSAASKEASPSEKHDAPSESKSPLAPVVPASTIYKLLGFTLAMIVVPIGTYFATLEIIFGGNSTWAGALAALMANVVLVAYIIVAMKEDQSERLELEEKARKSQ